MDTTDSHRTHLGASRPGVPGKNHLSKPLPDFCRDETTTIEHPQEALLTSNSVLLLIYGLTMGLVIGFSLGASSHTVLVSGM
jgi:hypothetical protein